MPKCFFPNFSSSFFLNFFFASFNAEPYSNFFFFGKCFNFSLLYLSPLWISFKNAILYVRFTTICIKFQRSHICSFGNWNQLGCGLWTQLGIIELFLLWKQKIPQNGDIYRARKWNVYPGLWLLSSGFNRLNCPNNPQCQYKSILGEIKSLLNLFTFFQWFALPTS